MVTEPLEGNNSRPESAPADSVREAWKQIGRFFIDNPTLVLSLLYALITGIGILSSWSLYGEFGISIFDYAEIGDFLLVAFKSPDALLNLAFALSIVLVAMLMYVFLPAWLPYLVRFLMLFRPSRERSERSERTFRRMLFWYSLLLPLLSVIFAAYATILSIHIRSQFEAQRIKQRGEAYLEVQYRTFLSPEGQVTKSGVELIGSTQRFVFFYDENDKRTIVIPQAQLVSIEVPE